jgi:hypothetical protein
VLTGQKPGQQQQSQESFFSEEFPAGGHVNSDPSTPGIYLPEKRKNNTSVLN